MKKYKYCIREKGDSLSTTCFIIESKLQESDAIFISEQISLMEWHFRCKNEKWPITIEIYTEDDEFLGVFDVDVVEDEEIPPSFFARKLNESKN